MYSGQLSLLPSAERGMSSSSLTTGLRPSALIGVAVLCAAPRVHLYAMARRPSSVRPSVRQSVNFCANRFFSQANGRIATKLTYDGLLVSLHPGCAQGQGQGQLLVRNVATLRPAAVGRACTYVGSKATSSTNVLYLYDVSPSSSRSIFFD